MAFDKGSDTPLHNGRLMSLKRAKSATLPPSSSGRQSNVMNARAASFKLINGKIYEGDTSSSRRSIRPTRMQ